MTQGIIWFQCLYNKFDEYEMFYCKGVTVWWSDKLSLEIITIFFYRLKTKFSLLNSNADTQKWKELLNFNVDNIQRGEEKCDVENILDRARHSEYRLSHKRSNEEAHTLLHTETTSDHNTDVKKLDKVVLDAEKYLASISTDSGVYDKNLGKVHRKFKINLLEGNFCKRE